jgi:hypothetical protein
MIAQCSTVTVTTSTRVRHVTREHDGGFRLHCSGGRTISVDDLVFASSGPPTARLLARLPGAAPQLAALNGIEFEPARLALHTDPVYAPADPNHRSFLNCDLRGSFCEASMWLASVVNGPAATTANLWKSWITHRARPAQVLHEAEFRHMLPTPGTLHAQERLGALQGLDGIWFAGGYLHPNDSQETALRSALRVAAGMHVPSIRSLILSSIAT